MFTVYPAVGSVPAGGTVQVTVDMMAENPGFCEEVSYRTALDSVGFVFITAVNAFYY